MFKWFIGFTTCFCFCLAVWYHHTEHYYFMVFEMFLSVFNALMIGFIKGQDGEFM